MANDDGTGLFHRKASLIPDLETLASPVHIDVYWAGGGRSIGADLRGFAKGALSREIIGICSFSLAPPIVDGCIGTTGSTVAGMLGPALDWVTQQWVKGTGRRCDLLSEAWLDGPVGGGFIGDRWLNEYAESLGAEAIRSHGGGLVQSFAVLDQPGFSVDQVNPTVTEFYETTGNWRLEVWSRWSPWFRPFGVVLSALFSRRLQQLNLPLDPMETSRGMTSEVIPIVGKDGSVLGSAWQRTLRATGQTVFGGYYGVVDLPSSGHPAIRVVFPLPNGSITVFLRPENAQGGALRLVSDGSLWGEPGAYLVVRGPGPTFWSRRVTLPERFEVYVDDEGVLRADHHLHFLRWRVLQMHYRIERTPSASETETHA